MDITGLTREQILLPGTAAYDEELAGFQTAVPRSPDVVVAARTPQDVQAAVRFATRTGRAAGVQSTGHGTTDPADGAVLVSTRRMDAVTVSGDRATVQAGARWHHVVDAAAPHGLAPLSGSAPDVGVAGYTLGGGTALLARTFGLAADRVRSLDVVTADGELRHVTADSDPDLFWALRGGRDNFGIVTALEIELVPLTTIHGGGIYFDAQDAAVLFERFRTWTAGLPETVNASIGMVPLPDLPFLPEPLRGRHVVHVRFAAVEEVEHDIGTWATPVLGGFGELPYTEAGSIYRDPPVGHGYHGDGVLVRDLDAGALRRVVELTGPGAAEPSVVDVRQLGGALAREHGAPSAVGYRDAAYIVRIIGTVATDDDIARAEAFQRSVFRHLEPWTLGRSLNFVYGRGGAARLAGVYPPDVAARLAELKRRYDGRNTFRANHTIAPA